MSAPTIMLGQFLAGPLFAEPMRVETVAANGPTSWAAGLVGTRSDRFCRVMLAASDLEWLLQKIDKSAKTDGQAGSAP